MIFNKNYDMSLWYIKENTKKYKKSLENFLIELPFEYIFKIRQILNNSNNLSSSNYSDYVKINNKIIYYFSFNKESGLLSLSKVILEYTRYIVTFELNLSPFILSEMKDNNYLIGSVTDYLLNRFDIVNNMPINNNFYFLNNGVMVISLKEELNGSMTYIYGKYYDLEKMVNKLHLKSKKKLKVYSFKNV